jgi:hypothetical protein
MSQVHEIASEALQYLASTDELEATLHSEVERIEYKVKATLGAFILLAEGTVAEREAKARNSAEFKDCCDEHVKALRAHKEVKNKRSTQTARFEWARSLNANRRQGGNI